MIVVIAPAFAFTMWMQRLAFGEVHYDFSVALLTILILVGIVFPWLRRRTELGVERSLFREHYEKRLALDRFGRKVVQIDEEILTRRGAVPW